MSQEKDTTEGRKREHLNREERHIIQRMLREGADKGEIARTLRRDKSTIKREVRRGSVVKRWKKPYQSRKRKVPKYQERKVYRAEAGQETYEQHRQQCGTKNRVVICAQLVRFVEGKVLGKEKWSVDAAIGYARENQLFEEMVTTKTFYNWIDDGLVKVGSLDLLLKVRRRHKKPRRERKKVLGKSIDLRPQEVETREEFGHWEGDGIVGAGQKGHLITLVERKLGIGFLFNVGDRKRDRIVEVVDLLEKRYGPDKFRRLFKTITFDNGAEFAAGDALEADGRTAVYYAHPYSSYERGTNENWNGIVRRFILKKSSFDNLTDSDMNRIALYINTLPRKRFAYKTPLALWNEYTYDRLDS
jgi:IS30 family transposase